MASIEISQHRGQAMRADTPRGQLRCPSAPRGAASKVAPLAAALASVPPEKSSSTQSCAAVAEQV